MNLNQNNQPKFWYRLSGRGDTKELTEMQARILNRNREHSGYEGRWQQERFEDSDMARNVTNEDGTPVKRENVYCYDPEWVVVKPSNARWQSKLNMAKVVEYAKSYGVKGQVQPVVVRPIENKRVQLSAGYHRQAAAVLFKLGSKEHGIEPHPDFKLRCTISDLNEREAYETSVIENKQRSEVSPMDDAHNMRTLQTLYSYTSEQVCEILGCTPAWLTTLRSLLLLPDDIQEAVHNRIISVRQAADLAAMSEEQRRTAIAASMSDDQREIVFQPALLDMTRQTPAETKAEADGEAVAELAKAELAKIDGRKLTKGIKRVQTEAGKRVSVSMKELRDYLATKTDNANVDTIKSAVLAFVRGEMKGEELDTKLAGCVWDETAVEA